MRDLADRLEQFAVDVILERRYGKRAYLLRQFLYLASRLYERIVRVRLWLYEERLMKNSPLGCVVVSIGNLTVGGTGKTPVVEVFAKTLQSRGRRVAILSRGYKSKQPPLLKRLHQKIFTAAHKIPPRVVSDGRSLLLDSRRAGDEPFMLGANIKGVPVVVDKDRVKSGLYAIKRWGVDTLLLDDGFQYFPLQKQRLDVVLVDSQAPFGNNYLLPRGTLREPPDHLKRADLVFITKCDQPGNDQLKEKIRKYNCHAAIIECKHQPLYLQDLFTDEKIPLDFLKERRITAFSGIAAPDSFENFLKTLGSEILYSRQFADHHRFTQEEILSTVKRSKALRVKAIVTTEKDAVRFPRLNREEISVPIYFLRVEIQIIGGKEHFDDCIRRICERQTPLTKQIMKKNNASGTH